MEIFGIGESIIYNIVSFTFNTLLLVIMNILFNIYLGVGIFNDLVTVDYENKIFFFLCLCNNKQKLLKLKHKKNLQTKIDRIEKKYLEMAKSLKNSYGDKITEINLELKNALKENTVIDYDVPEKVKRYLEDEYRKIADEGMAKIRKEGKRVVKAQKSMESQIKEIKDYDKANDSEEQLTVNSDNDQNDIELTGQLTKVAKRNESAYSADEIMFGDNQQ